MATKLEDGRRATMTPTEITEMESESAEWESQKADADQVANVEELRIDACRVLEEEGLESRAQDPDAPKEVTDYIAARDALPAPAEEPLAEPPPEPPIIG